jgi:hypothetical protein
MHVLTVSPVDPSTYLTWGWLSISIPNLIMVLITLGLLILALVLPFPGAHEEMPQPDKAQRRADEK